MNETAANDSLKLLPDYLESVKPLLQSDDLFIILQKLAVAILIGLLIGREREHSKARDEKIFAGIRTFPLISIFGFLSALISDFQLPGMYIISSESWRSHWRFTMELV